MPTRPNRSAGPRQRLIVYITLSVAAFLILIATLFFAGQQQNMTCLRKDDGTIDCLVTDSILGVIKFRDRVIQGVEKVSIGQTCEGVNCKYRLGIITSRGTVPLNEQYTKNYQRLQSIQDSLDSFFKDKTRKSVGMTQETNPILMVAIAAIFILLEIYLLSEIRQTRKLIRRVDER